MIAKRQISATRLVERFRSSRKEKTGFPILSSKRNDNKIQKTHLDSVPMILIQELTCKGLPEGKYQQHDWLSDFVLREKTGFPIFNGKEFESFRRRETTTKVQKLHLDAVPRFLPQELKPVQDCQKTYKQHGERFRSSRKEKRGYPIFNGKEIQSVGHILF